MSGVGKKENICLYISQCQNGYLTEFIATAGEECHILLLGSHLSSYVNHSATYSSCFPFCTAYLSWSCINLKCDLFLLLGSAQHT